MRRELRYWFRSELLFVERSVTVFLCLDFPSRESEARRLLLLTVLPCCILILGPVIVFLCVFAWEGYWRTLPPVGGYLPLVDFVAFRGYIELLDLLVFGFYSKSLKVGSLDRLVGCA